MASLRAGFLLNGTGTSNVHENGMVPYRSRVTVVLGAQWGDEGKGKVVDMLATDVDVVCRCQVISDLNIYFLFITFVNLQKSCDDE